VSLVVLRPDFEPPDTLAAWEKRHIDPLLDSYTHIAIVDRDVTVGDEFYHVHEKCLNADIISVEVHPSSRVFDAWERLTYWVRLEDRHRGCAVIYRTGFLKSVGGWPLVTTPDTWLLSHSRFTVNLPVVAIHNQSFNFAHSIRNQLRDGKSRAELHYPVWKTLLHSIVRIRPLVLLAYLGEKLRAAMVSQ